MKKEKRKCKRTSFSFEYRSLDHRDEQPRQQRVDQGRNDSHAETARQYGYHRDNGCHKNDDTKHTALDLTDTKQSENTCEQGQDTDCCRNDRADVKGNDGIDRREGRQDTPDDVDNANDDTQNGFGRFFHSFHSPIAKI